MSSALPSTLEVQSSPAILEAPSATRPLDRFISREELLARPLVTGAVSFDRRNPVEVDDAVKVEYVDGSHKGVRVTMLHPDIGLLLPYSEYLEYARKVGWTRYKKDTGLSYDITTLPEYVYKQSLGLDAPIPEGVPVVSLSYEFSMGKRSIEGVEMELARARIENTTYRAMNRRIRSGDDSPEAAHARLLFETARRIGAPAGKFHDIPKDAAAVAVASVFNMTSNQLPPRVEKLENVPLLWRNHGPNAYVDVVSARRRRKLQSLGIAIWGSRSLGHSSGRTITNISAPLRRLADQGNGYQIHEVLSGRDPLLTETDQDQIAQELALLAVWERTDRRRRDRRYLSHINRSLAA